MPCSAAARFAPAPSNATTRPSSAARTTRRQCRLERISTAECPLVATSATAARPLSRQPTAVRRGDRSRTRRVHLVAHRAGAERARRARTEAAARLEQAVGARRQSSRPNTASTPSPCGARGCAPSSLPTERPRACRRDRGSAQPHDALASRASAGSPPTSGSAGRRLPRRTLGVGRNPHAAPHPAHRHHRPAQRAVEHPGAGNPQQLLLRARARDRAGVFRTALRSTPATRGRHDRAIGRGCAAEHCALGVYGVVMHRTFGSLALAGVVASHRSASRRSASRRPPDTTSFPSVRRCRCRTSSQLLCARDGLPRRRCASTWPASHTTRRVGARSSASSPARSRRSASGTRRSSSGRISETSGRRDRARPGRRRCQGPRQARPDTKTTPPAKGASFVIKGRPTA